jgi:hypothetical protein
MTHLEQHDNQLYPHNSESDKWYGPPHLRSTHTASHRTWDTPHGRVDAYVLRAEDARAKNGGRASLMSTICGRRRVRLLDGSRDLQIFKLELKLFDLAEDLLTLGPEEHALEHAGDQEDDPPRQGKTHARQYAHLARRRAREALQQVRYCGRNSLCPLALACPRPLC